MPGMSAPNIGDPAPDFTLVGTGGAKHSLADYRGKTVVLAFYPGDFTPVCTRQLCSYRDEIDDFTGVDAVVLGVSAQDVDSHDRFASKHGFTFPLLADTDKQVMAAYGVLGPAGFVRRSVFVIDREGIVRWRHVGLTGLTYRKPDELIRVVKGLA
jgi:peroxiredoxin Q/BCP